MPLSYRICLFVPYQINGAKKYEHILSNFHERLILIDSIIQNVWTSSIEPNEVVG